MTVTEGGSDHAELRARSTQPAVTVSGTGHSTAPATAGRCTRSSTSPGVPVARSSPTRRPAPTRSTVPGNATYTGDGDRALPRLPADDRRRSPSGPPPVTQDIALEVEPGLHRARLRGPAHRCCRRRSTRAATPAGWSVVKRADRRQWAFNDPGGAGQPDRRQRRLRRSPTVTRPVSGTTTGHRPDHAGAGPDRRAHAGAAVQQRLPGPRHRGLRRHRRVHRRRHDLDQRLAPGRQPARPGRRGGARSTAAANQANVKLRFHYFGTCDWWWQVDNVQVVNRRCDPVPGGLVGRLHHRRAHRRRRSTA